MRRNYFGVIGHCSLFILLGFCLHVSPLISNKHRRVATVLRVVANFVFWVFDVIELLCGFVVFPQLAPTIPLVEVFSVFERLAPYFLRSACAREDDIFGFECDGRFAAASHGHGIPIHEPQGEFEFELAVYVIDDDCLV